MNTTTRKHATRPLQSPRLHLFILLAIAATLTLPARAATIPLDTMKPTGKITTAHTPEGLRLLSSKGEEGKVQTSRTFTTPLVITAVAKTSNQDLRLYFGDKGMIIFNWELNPTELRHHDPRTGEQHAAPGQGHVPIDTWVTVTWTIDDKGSRIQVDGKERYNLPGDYSGLSAAVGVGTYGPSTVTLKSLTISERKPHAKDDADDDTANANPILASAPAGNVPLGPTTAPSPSADPNAIERPEYRTSAKALVKTISTINAMTVFIGDDGYETGKTEQVYATVPGESRTQDESTVAWVRKGEGGHMRISAQEAIRAVKLRYPLWDRGRIELSFGDKYTPKDGGSGGTAFLAEFSNFVDLVDQIADGKTTVTRTTIRDRLQALASKRLEILGE